MSNAGERTSPRVNAALDVSLQTVDGDVPCETRDVSYEGVFIVRRDPLPLRKLIRFRTQLPDSDDELQMLGLVAHTVNRTEAAESDRDPGMGIQLFSLGHDTRQRWRHFVDDLYRRDPSAQKSLASSRRPRVPFRISSSEKLEQLRTSQLAEGELFVRNPQLYAPGTEVDCVIHHPDDDDTFSIPAEVTDAVDGSVKDRGLQLAVEVPDDRDEIEAFLGGPIGADRPSTPTPPPQDQEERT